MKLQSVFGSIELSANAKAMETVRVRTNDNMLGIIKL